MSKQLKILIVDDEQDYCDVMSMILSGEGYIVDSCNNGQEALKKLETGNFDLVLTDLMMPKMDGNQLLTEIKSLYKDMEVIMMTAYGTIEKAVAAMKQGAYTYVTKGENPEQLLAEIKRLKDVKALKAENQRLRQKLNTTDYLLESKNSDFQNLIEITQKAADSSANILILGESGVGKEVFARFIHKCSQRNENNFVDINCHAIPETVLESELFGHEKGAFTGATNKRIGRFEDANNGTLFLDEIGDIQLSTQAKLLKVIENKKLYPVGSNTPIEVDFRLLTATNKNLQHEIELENFREDLFYRLSTITIEIPPLRNRKEDLPNLIDYFLEKSQADMKKVIRKVETGVKNFLMEYSYPGNVRELKNLIERLVVLSDDGIIKENHLPNYSVENHNSKNIIKKSSSAISIENDDKNYENLTLKEVRKDVEAQYIQKIITQEKGNMNKVAEILGITRRQLTNKLTEFNL
ncbi:sigma-54-dependent transcriptional regulator [Anaerovorax odorimutans]|uniref:sigma-54-dependent transcriptional regulator n=1 Tax=Anaerovorax odorimutans TaxID=109327 RepID=UPI00041090CF|nr:sigma-54 dependent transcriptional regulator [Anaerovorax odorimutans]